MKKISVLLVLGLLLGFVATPVAANQTYTIGSGNFAEPQILAEAVKILIEDNTDLTINHVRNFQGSTLLHSAMAADDLQMYITWTGTQFAGILDMEVTEEWRDREKVFNYVKEQFDERFGYYWFEPFGFNNTYALAVREEMAEELNLEKASDLIEHAEDLVIGMDTTFRIRSGDGYEDFLIAYDIDKFKRAVAMDYGLLYRAVAEGNVDVSVAYSTDGRVSAMNLVILEDDQDYFPPYDGALVATNDFIEKYPIVKELVEPFIGAIDEEKMQYYNRLVDVEYQGITEVALQLIDDLVE